MPLPSSINDLSTTAGSNSPAGSESPSTIDDYLRVYASYIAQLRDASQSNAFSMATAGGSANSITATYSPAVVTPDNTTVLRFKAMSANTGATTFSPNGITAAPIVGGNHAALQGGEIVATGDVWVQWNSSIGTGSWVLLESSGGCQQVAPATSSLHATTAGQIAQQTLVAFTTAGTAGTLTLTPSPAISAYASPLRYSVKFSQNSTGADTINVSSAGAKSLKQYDSTGAKVAAIFATNQQADIVYDGTDFVLLDQLPAAGASAQSSSLNLKGSATGLSAVSIITADEIVLESSTGSYLTVRNINLSPSFANANGLNGLDTGTVQPSSFYDRWVISNGTTVGALFCAYGNSPVMPSGYTFKARVGPVRTDATANRFPLPFIQFGKRFNYAPKPATNLTAPPQIATGAVAFPSAVGWQGYAPPGAALLVLTIAHAQAGAGWLSNTPDYLYQYTQSVSGNSSRFTVQLPPVSASVYWGADSGTTGIPGLFLMGWEENL